MTNSSAPFFTDLDIPNYCDWRKAGYDHTLVDVREDWEYGIDHIPGALHIRLNDLPGRLAEIPTDKPVVVVCEHGVRSALAAHYLAYVGYRDVYNLVGGTSEWRKRWLPLAP